VGCQIFSAGQGRIGRQPQYGKCLPSIPRKPLEVQEKCNSVNNQFSLSGLNFPSFPVFENPTLKSVSSTETVTASENVLQNLTTCLNETKDDSLLAEFRGVFGNIIYRHHQCQTLQKNIGRLKHRSNEPPRFFNSPFYREQLTTLRLFEETDKIIHHHKVPLQQTHQKSFGFEVIRNYESITSL
jgi:hypothetical protein